MRKDYEKLFTRLEPQSPPDELFLGIMRAIQREERRRALLWRVVLVASVVAILPAFLSFESALLESGFVQFSELIFSDFSYILAYWDSFALALLESLPLVNAAMFVGVLFVFFASLARVARGTALAS